jgi:poly [ADP-ribose] polymerase
MIQSDWDMVSKYVTQTHCPTHTAYWLELVDLFRIEREGEFDNFIPFSDLPNRMLLWHGSRLTNYAGTPNFLYFMELHCNN